MDNLNTVKNPSYFVLHLRSGWNVNERLRFFAEGRNLTDKTYAGAVIVNDQFNRFANPAQGRERLRGGRVQVLSECILGGIAMDKVLLRVTEAAELLRVSRWTIYRWVEEGRLKGTKLGRGSLRIFAESIMALVEQRRTTD
ncbi:MAG: hypothetical protein KatS3mg082_1237 [Nitrospiraceae bacterium]|nr:MAG: hypothetical protein KatS3mg082_1237 [Nitrospiraceae bacterium]